MSPLRSVFIVLWCDNPLIISHGITSGLPDRLYGKFHAKVLETTDSFFGVVLLHSIPTNKEGKRTL